MIISGKIAALIITGIMGVFTVTILFLTSEKEIHRNNAFIRRYPHHPVQIKDTIDLKYNSYYFAGIESDTVYLGNITAPLFLMKVSIKTGDTSHLSLDIPDFNNFKFRNPRLKIKNGRYFLYDGSVPVLFTNDLNKRSSNKLESKIYFDQLEVIDSTHFLIRSRLTKSDELAIGILNLMAEEADFNKELLTKNIDGFFDVDGMMTSTNNTLFYVYFYRNQYLVIDKDGELRNKLNTIDTIQQADIIIARNTQRNLRKLASHPTTVNLKTTANEKYLLIQSGRLGKYEPKEMLREASIIDVYDYKKGTYEFSFYLYDHFGQKAKEFALHESKLIAMYDHYLTFQSFSPPDIKN